MFVPGLGETGIGDQFVAGQGKPGSPGCFKRKLIHLSTDRDKIVIIGNDFRVNLGEIRQVILRQRTKQGRCPNELPLPTGNCRVTYQHGGYFIIDGWMEIVGEGCIHQLEYFFIEYCGAVQVVCQPFDVCLHDLDVDDEVIAVRLT